MERRRTEGESKRVSFTFDGKPEYSIGFQLEQPRKDRPNQDTVLVTVSYPFDKETQEEVVESLMIPAMSFAQLLKEANEIDQDFAKVDIEDGTFSLRRDKDGAYHFSFATKDFTLHSFHRIDGNLSSLLDILNNYQVI